MAFPEEGPMRRNRTAILAIASCLLAGAAAAQDCPPQVFNQPLQQPRVIQPVDGVVNTALTVRQVEHACIPIWMSQDAQGNKISDPHWAWQPMTLRTYGSPRNGNNPNDPNLLFGIPGPTYRVRKAYLQDDTQPPGPGNPQVSDGTRFKLLLKNELPNNSYPYHDCQPAEVQEPPPPGSTTGTKIPQVSPECFHGADVTNIHYHGTHVSPQPHQDFVLLELFSSKQTNPTPPPVSETVAHASYQTDMNPFPWNQAPGTHWYHPHKHGSTSLQVLNGMAGSLLIQGPFDDWLYGVYKVDPNDSGQLETFEKVMVVQQVWPELNFYQKPHPNYPPQPLINGQADPVVSMKYGEVQRWRFVGATMQASAQVTVDFPPGFKVYQIAQDGVQFAPENWDRQPLINEDEGTFQLAPGNRIDLLVQAPPKPATAEGAAAPKRFPVTFQVFGNVADDLSDKLHVQRRTRLAKATAGQASPSLFTIELAGEAADMELPCPYGAAGQCATFPKMPWYLRDVEPSEIVGSRTIAFTMTDPETGVPTNPGTQPNGFWINQEAYNPTCANQSMVVGTAETWTVTNDSPPNHPFHIHVNPFQMVRYDTTQFQAPYVWQDTVALPAGGCNDVDAGPIFDQQQADQTCPGVCAAKGQEWNGQWNTTEPGAQSVCGCCTLKSVEVRSRYEDYTGGYVYHCHFLGHEDRGMMHNVQTVCPGGQPGSWIYGQTRTDGSADDCSVPSQTPALPACPPPGTYPAGAGKGHGHH
jgi:FtsP/CotA-like multicopper oxidase with cupredoxin domain